MKVAIWTIETSAISFSDQQELRMGPRLPLSTHCDPRSLKHLLEHFFPLRGPWVHHNPLSIHRNHGGGVTSALVRYQTANVNSTLNKCHSVLARWIAQRTSAHRTYVTSRKLTSWHKMISADQVRFHRWFKIKIEVPTSATTRWVGIWWYLCSTWGTV